MYLLWIAVAVAYIFTSIPEWTTWTLLGMLALYDLYAVLTPHGPLQLLISLAVERQEDIPALVYDARVPLPRHRRSPAREQAAAAGGLEAGSGGGAPVGLACEGALGVARRVAVAEATESDALQFVELELHTPRHALVHFKAAALASPNDALQVRKESC